MNSGMISHEGAKTRRDKRQGVDFQAGLKKKALERLGSKFDPERVRYIKLGAEAMLGYAAKFRQPKTTQEWMTELRQGDSA
jgi:hypothetical protein